MHLLPWPVLQALVAKPLLAQFGGRVRVAVSGGAPPRPPLPGAFWPGLLLVQAMARRNLARGCEHGARQRPCQRGPRAAGHVEVARTASCRCAAHRDERLLEAPRKTPLKPWTPKAGWHRRPGRHRRWLHLHPGRIMIIVTSTGEKSRRRPGARPAVRPAARTDLCGGREPPFIACVAVLKRDEWCAWPKAWAWMRKDPGSLNNPGAPRQPGAY